LAQVDYFVVHVGVPAYQQHRTRLCGGGPTNSLIFTLSYFILEAKMRTFLCVMLVVIGRYIKIDPMAVTEGVDASAELTQPARRPILIETPSSQVAAVPTVPGRKRRIKIDDPGEAGAARGSQAQRILFDTLDESAFRARFRAMLSPSG